MSESLDQRFFDFCFKVLNYATEFCESPGYASLRLTDILEKLVELSSEIESVDRKEFYTKLNERFKNRRLMSTRNNRSVFLDELMQLFVDEWRNG